MRHTFLNILDIDYYNHAPQALDTLYLHLWPNAYRNRQTAYVQQALRTGNTDFYYALDTEHSGIDSLAFQLNGQAVDWAYLDQVITHKVGHNWFYGILGYNERTHPWMDEGLNSYYEQRYMRQFHESSPPLPAFLMVDTSMTLGDIGYLYQARRRLDQAPNNIGLIPRKPDISPVAIINEKSRDVDLSIIGFRDGLVKHQGVELFEGYAQIGNTLFVNAASQKVRKSCRVVKVCRRGNPSTF